MRVIVKVAKSFKKQAKPLLKKFSSLRKDLSQLESELIKNPHLGVPIGKSSYKIRLAVKSKGKGKRGGLRVISHIETEIIGIIENEGEEIIVNLISIYDKSETESITDKELNDLISGLQTD